MHFRSRSSLWVAGALLSVAACSPAGAQAVYKCGSRSYSQQPCANRAVNTDEAPVPAKSNRSKADLRRLEQNRALARTLRRKPGESAAEFETRRRRAGLMPEDRDECARLDKRMPVEEASMNNPDKREVSKAEAALEKSRKRFSELQC